MVTCNADLIKIVETRIFYYDLISWGGVNVNKNMHDRDLYGNEKTLFLNALGVWRA